MKQKQDYFIVTLIWLCSNFLTERTYIFIVNTMFGLNYALYMLWEERNMLKKLKAECENQNRWCDMESILKVVKHFTDLQAYYYLQR